MQVGTTREEAREALQKCQDNADNAVALLVQKLSLPVKASSTPPLPNTGLGKKEGGEEVPSSREARVSGGEGLMADGVPTMVSYLGIALSNESTSKVPTYNPNSKPNLKPRPNLEKVRAFGVECGRSPENHQSYSPPGDAHVTLCHQPDGEKIELGVTHVGARVKIGLSANRIYWDEDGWAAAVSLQPLEPGLPLKELQRPGQITHLTLGCCSGISNAYSNTLLASKMSPKEVEEEIDMEEEMELIGVVSIFIQMPYELETRDPTCPVPSKSLMKLLEDFAVAAKPGESLEFKPEANHHPNLNPVSDVDPHRRI